MKKTNPFLTRTAGFLLISLYYFMSNPVQAQQLFTATSSEITFFSDAPLEDIEAVNKAGQSVINTGTRDIAVKVPIKSFVFPKSLMQEHFNENYLESEKFPYALFKGKINEALDFTKPGTYDVSATGKLTIHGVERDQTLKGKLTIQPEKLNLNASFEVALVDHKIKVPEVVFMKIAEKVLVKCQFGYQVYEKKMQ